MNADQVPQVARVDIQAVDPEAADRKHIAYLRAKNNVSLEDVAYLIKIYLSAPLPVTGSGLALYVGNTQIDKYWQFPKGIYFNVYDPAFVGAHAGQEVRF